MGRYTETINIRVSPELKRALEHAAMKLSLIHISEPTRPY